MVSFIDKLEVMSRVGAQQNEKRVYEIQRMDTPYWKLMALTRITCLIK